MTTQELEGRLYSITVAGYGAWRVTFERRGMHVSTRTTNAEAIDRINEHKRGDVADREKGDGYYTYRQALQSLYDECLRDYTD